MPFNLVAVPLNFKPLVFFCYPLVFFRYSQYVSWLLLGSSLISKIISDTTWQRHKAQAGNKQCWTRVFFVRKYSQEFMGNLSRGYFQWTRGYFEITWINGWTMIYLHQLTLIHIISVIILILLLWDQGWNQRKFNQWPLYENVAFS